MNSTTHRTGFVTRGVRVAALLIAVVQLALCLAGCSRKPPQHSLPTATDPAAVDVMGSETVTAVPTQAATAEPTEQASAEPTEASTEAATAEPTAAPTEAGTPAPAMNEDGYPALISPSGTIVKYGDTGIFRIDNTGYEGCGYVDGVVRSYMDLVNRLADALPGVQVYSMIIPTSYAITIPDNVKGQVQYYVDQKAYMESAYSLLNSKVKRVSCYERLMQHRNEYIFFRTDHHWNGTGAYYAYECFCQAKGITPYTMAQREEVQFDGFLGTFYNLSGSDSALMPADTIYAYKPYCKTATMKFYEDSGSAVSWPIIQDVTTWNASSKYSCFAGSDHGLTEFTNPEVAGGALIVIKDSFGNALMPYLVDHYSKVYEIDYRHWKGDLKQFAVQNGVNDILFANNFHNISNRSAVAKMSQISGLN